jgi:hypothetical protein
VNLRDVDRIYPGWAEDTLRVATKQVGSESGFVPFKLNRMQRQEWGRLLATHRRRFLRLKARQMGETTKWLGSHIQRCQFLAGYKVGVVCLFGDAGALPVAHTLQTMVRMQPPSWTASAPRLVNETASLLRWSNGSSIQLFTQGGGQVGTGLTFHRLHFTEYAKYDNPEVTRAALLPALTPDGEEVIESTPFGFNHYKTLWDENYQQPDPLYEASFSPWWLADEYVAPVPPRFQPTPEEATLIARHGLRAEQIAFRREKKQEIGRLFPQEFAESPEECFLATGDSVFGFDTISRLKEVCCAPRRTDHDGLLHLWQEPYPGVPYVVGADCAEGVPGGDYSAAVVLRADSGAHVGTLMDAPPFPASRERRMSPNDFARLLVTLGRLFNDASLAIELNGPGSGVITAVRDIHTYPNIVRHAGHDGFRTNAPTKSALVTGFRAGLESHSFATEDARVPQQMADFVVLETSATHEKVGARSGAKDDLLMATMIGYEARAQALSQAMAGPAVVRWR